MESVPQEKTSPILKIEDNKKPVIEQKENKDNKKSFDIDKLAYAIAMAETHNCERWYWKLYNNCFWIKNWNTAPCKKIWNNNMCIYETKEESYEAFKKIRSTWYKIYPTKELASRRTWNDNPITRLSNVWYYYNK